MSTIKVDHKKKYNFKDKIEIAEAIVTIFAIIVGGLWTYKIFIKERASYPHANIKHNISHIAISDKINLLRVAIELTNTGNSKMVVNKSLIRVQQILPILPCVKASPCSISQVNDSLRNRDRKEDRFAWPMIGQRTKIWDKPLELEPSEKDLIDFEFAISSDVNQVRIYSYFRNEKKKTENEEIGWSISSYYKLKKVEEKK